MQPGECWPKSHGSWTAMSGRYGGSGSRPRRRRTPAKRLVTNCRLGAVICKLSRRRLTAASACYDGMPTGSLTAGRSIDGTGLIRLINCILVSNTWNGSGCEHHTRSIFTAQRRSAGWPGSAGPTKLPEVQARRLRPGAWHRDIPAHYHSPFPVTAGLDRWSRSLLL